MDVNGSSWKDANSAFVFKSNYKDYITTKKTLKINSFKNLSQY